MLVRPLGAPTDWIKRLCSAVWYQAEVLATLNGKTYCLSTSWFNKQWRFIGQYFFLYIYWQVGKLLLGYGQYLKWGEKSAGTHMLVCVSVGISKSLLVLHSTFLQWIKDTRWCLCSLCPFGARPTWLALTLHSSTLLMPLFHCTAQLDFYLLLFH